MDMGRRTGPKDVGHGPAPKSTRAMGRASVLLAAGPRPGPNDPPVACGPVMAYCLSLLLRHVLWLSVALGCCMSCDPPVASLCRCA